MFPLVTPLVCTHVSINSRGPPNCDSSLFLLKKLKFVLWKVAFQNPGELFYIPSGGDFFKTRKGGCNPTNLVVVASIVVVLFSLTYSWQLSHHVCYEVKADYGLL